MNEVVKFVVHKGMISIQHGSKCWSSGVLYAFVYSCWMDYC